MRAVVQRVTSARVQADDDVTGEIGAGLLALIAVGQGDGPGEAEWLVEKLANVRIFQDGAGKMNRSLMEAGGEALVISQFTLYGDARKGRRPNFMAAAPPEVAEPLIERVVAGLRRRGVATATGRFGAHMVVSLENDGPVTIILETPPRETPPRETPPRETPPRETPPRETPPREGTEDGAHGELTSRKR